MPRRRRTRALVAKEGTPPTSPKAYGNPSASGTQVLVVLPASADAIRSIELYLARLAVMPSHVALDFTLGVLPLRAHDTQGQSGHAFRLARP